MTPTPDTLTAAGLARRLKVQTETVRRWCAEGRIVATKFGGSWAISRDVADAFAKDYQKWQRAARKGR